MSESDIFEERPDDDKPVTRGEMRRLHKGLRNDIKWSAALLLVGNQTLSHVELPPVAGFVGGGLFVSLAVAKLFVAK
mgnify:CR=1 FL=1